MSEITTEATTIVSEALELGPNGKPMAPLTWIDRQNIRHDDSYVYTREMLARAAGGVSEGAIAGGGVAASLPFSGVRH